MAVIPKMFLFNCFRGTVGLAKDAFRFVFFLLKRPHYVAVLLALIVGIFYVNGIPPKEISGFISGKWNAFVENRRETFKEDYKLLFDRFLRKKSVPDADKKQDMDIERLEKLVKENAELEKKLSERKEKKIKQMKEETFGWQKSFETAKKTEKKENKNTIKGILTVVGADRIRIKERTFSLNVRLRPGKAGKAYQDLKQHFDGSEAGCIPNQSDPDKAECFVGKSSLSQMLIDYAYADPD